MTDARRLNRQWLAWAILLSSFFLCVVISVSTPLIVNAFLQNATQPLESTVQANQGTVGIDDETGQRRAVLAGEAPQEVGPRAKILTDTTASALVEIAASDDADPLARLQISGNSEVRFDRIDTPRFRISREPHRLYMNLRNGRVRLQVPEFNGRPVDLLVTTPQSTVNIARPGQYTLEVDAQGTQVTVTGNGGRAAVSALDETLELLAGQRAEVPEDGPPVGPLDPARNLVRNGDFSEGLNNWSAFSWQVELPDQPKGVTEVRPINGDPTLHFKRDGVGHADVRVTQSLNQDVSDYDSLRLSLTLRVLQQSLGVCGVQGSECPLFVVVNYIDESGVSRVWQHGFYATGTVDDSATPGACISCAVVQRPHERVPLNQLYFYDVDLIQELASQGYLPPRLIETISLIASGHSFETAIADVSLIVEESAESDASNP